MTRDETKGLIRSIVSLYPNWKPENLTETVNAWHWALEEYPAQVIKGALQIYLKTNTTGFAPSVSQLIASAYAPKKSNQLSEGEAWALVKRAIQDGGYHAEERFNELPPSVQKAVGSPNMIHQWSQTESAEVNTVIMSNFQRAYKTVLEREEFKDKVPEALSDMVMKLSEKVSFDNRLLEAKEGNDEKQQEVF